MDDHSFAEEFDPDRYVLDSTAMKFYLTKDDPKNTLQYPMTRVKVLKDITKLKQAISNRNFCALNSAIHALACQPVTRHIVHEFTNKALEVFNDDYDTQGGFYDMCRNVLSQEWLYRIMTYPKEPTYQIHEAKIDAAVRQIVLPFIASLYLCSLTTDGNTLSEDDSTRLDLHLSNLCIHLYAREQIRSNFVPITHMFTPGIISIFLAACWLYGQDAAEKTIGIDALGYVDNEGIHKKTNLYYSNSIFKQNRETLSIKRVVETIETSNSIQPIIDTMYLASLPTSSNHTVNNWGPEYEYATRMPVFGELLVSTEGIHIPRPSQIISNPVILFVYLDRDYASNLTGFDYIELPCNHQNGLITKYYLTGAIKGHDEEHKHYSYMHYPIDRSDESKRNSTQDIRAKEKSIGDGRFSTATHECRYRH